MKGELEKVQQEHLDAIKKVEKMTSDQQRMQEHSNLQRSQLETQTDRVRDLQNQLRYMEGQQDRGGKTTHSMGASNGQWQAPSVNSLTFSSVVDTGPPDY